MRIKLDENLPASLAAVLGALGHDVDTVVGERLGGSDDPTVWQAAQQAERFFVSQDLDFSDARRFAPGTHEGLLLVRLRAPGRQALRERLEAVFQNEDVEDWKGCLVVCTETKVRIRRP